MSHDGADLGITAEDGMKAAMGADQEEMPRRTPAELRAEIEADQEYTYSGVANTVALALIQLFEQRPELATWPAEIEGAWFWTEDAPELDGVAGEQFPKSWGKDHPDQEMPLNLLEFKPVDDRDLYGVLKEARPDLAATFSDITGFQWGWAVNAAKYIVGQPPVPNPAIVTIPRG